MTGNVVRGVLVTLALAVPVMVLAAGMAGVVSEDFAVTVSAKGETVTLAVTNNSATGIKCAAFLVRPYLTGEYLDAQDVLYSAGFDGAVFVLPPIAPGAGQVDIPDVAAGEYQVEWGCINPGNEKGGT